MSRPLVRLLDDWAASGREPGGAVCVMRGDDVLVEHEVGTRDGRSPWTPDTLVMAYSVAKPLAALTVLDVVAAGDLRLDQRVAEVWPGWCHPAFPEPVEALLATLPPAPMHPVL